MTPATTGIDIPILETERLKLRPFRRSDLDDYAALNADPEVQRYMGGVGWDCGRSWRHLAFLMGHWHLSGAGTWAVEDKATGDLAGKIGFSCPDGWPGFELAWMLARRYWGRGYATEGGRAALGFAFEELGREHVISLIRPINGASIRVAERLGERLEGTSRVADVEYLVYGIDRPSHAARAAWHLLAGGTKSNRLLAHLSLWDGLQRCLQRWDRLPSPAEFNFEEACVGRISRLLCRSAALALLLTPGAAGAFAATIELVSQADPVPDSFGTSFSSGMSADGRYVLFHSTAPNLVSGQVDDNGFYDLFLRDRVAGTTTLISHVMARPGVAGRGAQPFDPHVFVTDASLSADGRYVAFISFWTDLVPNPGGANRSGDVYLWDRITGATTLISHAAGDPAVTADGFAVAVRDHAGGDDVAFTSSANNLVAGQILSAAGRRFNVFLYHRPTGSLTLVSHRFGAPVTGGNGDNDDSGGLELSADGGSVAFATTATDLIPGPGFQPGAGAVFLYQRATGTLSLVSHNSASTLGFPNNRSFDVRLSADGRWVAFISYATNLVAGQLPNPQLSQSNAFLYDRAMGTVRLVSHTTASPQTPGTASTVAISADGRYIAFDSPASNLVPGQVNGGGNVFVYDRVANAIALVSHNRGSATTTASGFSFGPESLSADGRYIAYQSTAGDLVPHQTDIPGSFDIFVYDRVARTTVLASHVPTSLTTSANGASTGARISADGGMVAFGSTASNLGEGQVDPNDFADLFLFDRKSAEVTAVAPRAPDVPLATPFGPSSSADLSADGRFVVFGSAATGLVAGQIDVPDTTIDEFGNGQGTWDIFLRDRATGKSTLLSRSQASPPTASGGDSPALSADGAIAVFRAPYPGPNGDELARLQVYDRTADALTLANHLPDAPGQPDGTPEDGPALSADGRYVAYTCAFCHLVAGQQDPNQNTGTRDVFLFDRLTGANTLVSHDSGSLTTTGDRDSREPRISADGRFILFLSGADNLVAGQTGAPVSANLFVFDRTTGLITLVNHSAGSPAASSGPAQDAALSADGRWIAYRSAATDLVPGQADANGVTDIFLYDVVAGGTVLVSHASSSSVTTGSSDREDYASNGSFALSADGHWVVFTSQATDLVPGGVDPSQATNVYLFDRTSGGVTLVSSSAGSATASSAWQPGISADGSRISFLSSATDLVPGQSGGAFASLFVQDRATGARTLVGPVQEKSFYAGVNGNVSFVPRLSADGRVVAFTSDSPLVAGDSNQTWDAFVYDADAAGGPVTVPPCVLFNGALRANVRKPLTAAGACGVPATAKQVAIRLTVSRGTGQGNVQLFTGSATTAAAGILRFSRGANRSAPFTLTLGNGAFSLLPFVAGNGTVRTSVEIDGYLP